MRRADGWFPVGDTAFDRWAMRALDEVGRSSWGFGSWHLPDIDPHTTMLGSLAQGSRLLLRAEQSLSDHGGQGEVALALPGGTTSTLDADPPGIETWSFDDPEPASIYYFEPRYLLNRGRSREEYRCAYPDQTIDGLPLSLEYVCGRELDERDKGWEFSRTLWMYLLEPPHRLLDGRLSPGSDDQPDV